MMYLKKFQSNISRQIQHISARIIMLLIPLALFYSCKSDKTEKSPIELSGTWQLISAVTTVNGKDTFSDFTKDQRMIKIINAQHFAFLRHDLKPNKEGKNNFDAGGGKYTLKGNRYTEYLEYYNDKNWEGKVFTFELSLKKDTLYQTGIEKVDEAGVNRVITEKYVKLPDNHAAQ